MAVSSFLRGVLRRNHGHSNHSHQNDPTPLTLTESPSVCSASSESGFYHHLFVDRHQQALSVPQKLVIEIVRDHLNDKDYRAKAVPRLPMVIPKLLRSLRDPDSSAKDYVAIIDKDPVMSAAVLKLANSSYFNPSSAKIDDIERAVVKLGITGLRAVLSAAVMQPIIYRQSAYFSQTGQRLWAHSLNCAVACEIIGLARGYERFKVYLMGLVHDIGKITLFSELCKEFKLNGEEQPSGRAFIPLMRGCSSSLSYLIARDWQLPQDICLALQEQINVSEGASVSPFGHLLFQANIACELYALTSRNKREELNFILNDFQLPTDLFDKLDEVSTQN